MDTNAEVWTDWAAERMRDTIGFIRQLEEMPDELTGKAELLKRETDQYWRDHFTFVDHHAKELASLF